MTMAEDVPGLANARFVIEALRSAGLRFPFSADTNNVEKIWAAQLSPFSLEVLQEAVRQWISSDTHDFPAVGEFGSMCGQLQREANRARALRNAQDNPHPGDTCGECGEGRGWVTVKEGDVGEPSTVRPCRSCRPAQYEKWSEGHFLPHTVSGPRETTLFSKEAVPPPEGFMDRMRALVNGQKIPDSPDPDEVQELAQEVAPEQQVLAPESLPG